MTQGQSASSLEKLMSTFLSQCLWNKGRLSKFRFTWGRGRSMTNYSFSLRNSWSDLNLVVSDMYLLKSEIDEACLQKCSFSSLCLRLFISEWLTASASGEAGCWGDHFDKDHSAWWAIGSSPEHLRVLFSEGRHWWAFSLPFSYRI